MVPHGQYPPSPILRYDSAMTTMLCSACLLGIRCRYDGAGAPDSKVLSLRADAILIPVCPEQLGGLPTPREPCERRGNQVFTASGREVTEQFIRGAEEVLRIAELYGATTAILKQRSPSCGCGLIHDGSFTGRLQPGDGVTAELLKRHGIRVLSEDDL